MKKNVFLILFILLALIVTGSIVFKKFKASPLQKNAEIGKPAPDFELKDVNGKKWKLGQLRGKIVILNFWASWCNDCKEEKKSIQAYLNKNGIANDIVFLTVAYRDNPLKVKEFVKNAGYSFPVLIDDGDVSSAYGVKGVPETFLIDKNGILRRKIVGPIQWDNPHIVPHLRQVLS